MSNTFDKYWSIYIKYNIITVIVYSVGNSNSNLFIVRKKIIETKYKQLYSAVSPLQIATIRHYCFLRIFFSVMRMSSKCEIVGAVIIEIPEEIFSIKGQPPLLITLSAAR